MQRALLSALTVLVVGLAISCSTEDTETNELVDPIKIDTGYVSGTLTGDVGKQVRIYRGIPYAAPPLGDLRWKPPQPATPWTGIRECIHFCNSCPAPAVPPDPAGVPNSEDCLYLNVLTPAKKASDSLPVMVWLHGGGYTLGSGSSELYNSARLSSNGVVLVTTNMRLGTMGLLAHPLLSKESPNGISGNYMFLDMIAALEWVQRNIGKFGGNAKNATIFGCSGGGAKVSCLMASSLTKGLFQRAIFESGAAAKWSPGKALKDLEELGEKFFAKLGVDKDPHPLKAARALPAETLIEAEINLTRELAENTDDVLWDSAIDGHFLTDFPANIFRAGKQSPIPVITSANLGELTGPGNYVMPYLVPDYLNILLGVNKAGQKGYACIFDKLPGRWKQEGCVSFHGLEQSYVFGDWDNSSGWWPVTFKSLAGPAGAKSLDPGFNDGDRQISENMMALWSQFARSGDPNVEDLVGWPAYDSEMDQYLYIGESLHVKPGFSKIIQEK